MLLTEIHHFIFVKKHKYKFIYKDRVALARNLRWIFVTVVNCVRWWKAAQNTLTLLLQAGYPKEEPLGTGQCYHSYLQIARIAV